MWKQKSGFDLQTGLVSVWDKSWRFRRADSLREKAMLYQLWVYNNAS